MSQLGWREWAGLPDLGVARIKVKVDTGARTSSLHAFDLELDEREGQAWARFEIHPLQRSAAQTVSVEAPVVEHREVRSSNGQVERRPVIRTRISLIGDTWPIDVTLTRRDAMGFRMLVGRSGLPRGVLVDPHRSFMGGR